MKIEIRNNKVILDGYVNAVARDSKELHENGIIFVEQIEPKAFERALKRAGNIFCLLDHDYNKVLGSTKEGNIKLKEDNIGLRATCEITDKDVIQSAKENKLRGWSFGFSPLKQKISQLGNGIEHRVVEELNLFEVSIIDENMIPAYDGTSIEERSQNIQVRNQGFENALINIIEDDNKDNNINEKRNKEGDKTKDEDLKQNQDAKEKAKDDIANKFYEIFRKRIADLKAKDKEYQK